LVRLAIDEDVVAVDSNNGIQFLLHIHFPPKMLQLQNFLLGSWLGSAGQKRLVKKQNLIWEPTVAFSKGHHDQLLEGEVCGTR
jgi:hypothetical protein